MIHNTIKTIDERLDIRALKIQYRCKNCGHQIVLHRRLCEHCHTENEINYPSIENYKACQLDRLVSVEY